MPVATPSRTAERRADRDIERAAMAAALVPVVIFARLSAEAEVVEVDSTAGLTVTPSAFALDDDAAALRAHLANSSPYGPTVRRVVLVGFVGDPLTVQELALVGRLSAVERTAPDRDSVWRWADVGAQALMGPGMPIVKQAETRPV